MSWSYNIFDSVSKITEWVHKIWNKCWVISSSIERQLQNLVSKMKFDKFLCFLLMYSTTLLVLWVFITVSSCKLLLWVWVIVQDVIVECCCQLSRFLPIKYFIVSTCPTCSCLWRYCLGIKSIILTTLAILATVPRQLLRLVVKTCAFANSLSTLHYTVMFCN